MWTDPIAGERAPAASIRPTSLLHRNDAEPTGEALKRVAPRCPSPESASSPPQLSFPSQLTASARRIPLDPRPKPQGTRDPARPAQTDRVCGVTQPPGVRRGLCASCPVHEEARS